MNYDKILQLLDLVTDKLTSQEAQDSIVFPEAHIKLQIPETEHTIEVCVTVDPFSRKGLEISFVGAKSGALILTLSPFGLPMTVTPETVAETGRLPMRLADFNAFTLSANRKMHVIWLTLLDLYFKKCSDGFESRPSAAHDDVLAFYRYVSKP